MSRRLRILTIGHSYCVALNRAPMRDLARRDDLDITMVSPAFFHGDLRPIAIEPEPDDSALRLVPLRARLTRLIHVFSYDDRALRRLIRDGNFDVVHAWEEPYIFAGYQIARALKKTASRFCFRTSQSYVKRYPPPFNYFERDVLARAQGWISGGRLVREAMIRRGFPKDRGRTVTLAVDTHVFKPSNSHDRCRRAEELGLRGPIIGFVGRLTEAKGLDVLMGALEGLRPERPWSLLLLGSGDYEGKILRWARARGWADRVRIKLVNHSDVPRYVGCMDLLVAPSQSARNWREQFGRMLIEAFCMGVPVIGSDSGEIPFVVGDAGRIVGEHDIAGWTRAIEALLDGPELRTELRERGLVRAQCYSVETIAAQYHDYFRWLADQPLRR